MSTKNRRRGHVRQRGATWTAYWRVRGDDGQSVQRSEGGFATATDAERHLTTVLGKLDNRTYTEPKRADRLLTLRMFVEQTWLPSVRTSLRASTLESYQANLRLHVYPTLGNARLSEITPDRLNRLYAALLEHGDQRTKVAEGEPPRGLSVASVRYQHAIIRRLLGDAVKWDLVARNAALRAQPPKAARTEMMSWSPEQLRTFLDHVADDRLAALWTLLATTGCRRGEALGVRWRDVRLDGADVSIVQTVIAVAGGAPRFSTPKTEKGRRRISLDLGTIAALRSHRARQAEERLAAGNLYDVDSDLVFANELGQVLHPAHVSTAFRRHAKAAGLPPIRLHDVRHSYATAALEAGIPTRIVADRLGHASTKVTENVYQHVSSEMDQRAAEHVATLIFGAGVTDSAASR